MTDPIKKLPEDLPLASPAQIDAMTSVISKSCETSGENFWVKPEEMSSALIVFLADNKENISDDYYSLIVDIASALMSAPEWRLD